MPYRAVVVAVLLCLAASVVVPAAGALPGPTGVQTMVGGLWGGETNTIAIEPQRPSVIVADVDGLTFRTTNGGASWHRLQNIYGSVVAFDPSRAGWAFGEDDSGLGGVSHDGGATWDWQTAFPNGNASVAVAVTNGGVAYLANLNGGVARSTDGLTWTPVNAGLPPLNLNGTTLLEFAISPTPPYVAYAVLDTGAVYRSADGGATWSQTAGSVPSCDSTGVGSLTISPADPTTAYLNGCGGGYMTRDSGTSWTPLTADLSQDRWLAPIAIDPTHPSTLYATAGPGIVRSEDGGATWSDPMPVLGDSAVWTVASDPANPGVLYAGTAAGVSRSVDGGETWRPDATGINGQRYIWGVASDPRAPARVYAATDSGVWRSADGGRDWQYASDGLQLQDPATPTIPTSITVNPGDPSTLYTAIHGGFATSHDRGDTWSMLSVASIFSWAAMGVDPDNPQHLIAPTEDGVATSFDGGQTWSTTTLCTFNCIAFERVAFAPSDPAVVYVAGGWNGVWRSVDGGKTWNQVTPGTTTPYDLVAVVFAVDPADPNTIVYQMLPPGSNLSCFGGQRAMQISHDGGQTWQKGRACLSSAIFMGDGATSTLYGMNNGREYMSRDDGATLIPAANLRLGNDATGLALAGRLHVRGRAAPRTALYVADDEVIRRPFIAAPPTARFHLLVHRPVLRLRRNVIHLRVNCSDTWRAACHGQVVLFGDGRAAAVFNYRIPVGHVGAVTLHLNPAAWRHLGAIHHRTYNLRIMSHGPDLTQQTDRRVVDLVRVG